MREKFITRTIEETTLRSEYLRKDSKEFFRIEHSVYGRPDTSELEKIAMDALECTPEYCDISSICIHVDTEIIDTHENKYRMSVERFTMLAEFLG